jgi:hypothetical protein
VGTDTAHDSAQVETIDDRDLSVGKNADNIEIADEVICDAIQQSFGIQETFGDSSETKVEMAVEIS